MKIKVKKNEKTREIKIKKNITVSELAKQLNITLQNHIVKVDDRLVPDDEKLKEGNTVEFFIVISGG